MCLHPVSDRPLLRLASTAAFLLWEGPQVSARGFGCQLTIRWVEPRRPSAEFDLRRVIGGCWVFSRVPPGVGNSPSPCPAPRASTLCGPDPPCGNATPRGRLLPPPPRHRRAP